MVCGVAVDQVDEGTAVAHGRFSHQKGAVGFMEIGVA
jgi:hypothetical protein